MKKSALSIVNVIGTNPSQEFLKPYLDEPDIDAVIYYEYRDYSAWRGIIWWVNNKPIISMYYGTQKVINRL